MNYFLTEATMEINGTEHNVKNLENEEIQKILRDIDYGDTLNLAGIGMLEVKSVYLYLDLTKRDKYAEPSRTYRKMFIRCKSIKALTPYDYIQARYDEYEGGEDAYYSGSSWEKYPMFD